MSSFKVHVMLFALFKMIINQIRGIVLVAKLQLVIMTINSNTIVILVITTYTHTHTLLTINDQLNYLQ